MSSKQYQALTYQFPNEALAIQRINDLFDRSGTEIGMEGLFDLVQPSSTQALLKILTLLVDAGFISKKFRVVSPSNQEGLKEFDSFLEIPSELNDWRSQNEIITITPSLIRVIYKSLCQNI